MEKFANKKPEYLKLILLKKLDILIMYYITRNTFYIVTHYRHCKRYIYIYLIRSTLFIYTYKYIQIIVYRASPIALEITVHIEVKCIYAIR